MKNKNLTNKKHNKIMIKIFLPLIFLITALSIVSCNTTPQKEIRKLIKMKSVKDVLTNLKPLKSFFEISNTEESVVNCEQGTVLYIEKNTFVFENGKIPNGIIKLEIKESYTLSNIISENLHTESRGEILETGGMIFIEAKADGKKLKIKEGKVIQLGFPKSGNSKEMDLFYSVKKPNGVSTWIPDYQIFQTEIKNNSESSFESESRLPNYPITITDDMYTFFLSCDGGNAAVIDAKFLNSKQNVWDYLNDQQNSNVSYAKEFYANKWNFTVNFNIDKNGKMINFKPADDDDGMYYDRPPIINDRAYNLYINYLKSLPPFEVSSFSDGITKDWIYCLSVAGSRDIDWKKFKEKFRARYNNSKKLASEKINRLDLDYYVFGVTKLGWINCDRFIDLPENQKTDYIVKTPGIFDTKIRLIFTDNYSILNGEKIEDYTIFKGVPLNKKIKIIGIGFNNGNPNFSKAQTQISKEAFTLTKFKELKLEELEKELNNLK